MGCHHSSEKAENEVPSLSSPHAALSRRNTSKQQKAKNDIRAQLGLGGTSEAPYKPIPEPLNGNFFMDQKPLNSFKGGVSLRTSAKAESTTPSLRTTPSRISRISFRDKGAKTIDWAQEPSADPFSTTSPVEDLVKTNHLQMSPGEWPEPGPLPPLDIDVTTTSRLRRVTLASGESISGREEPAINSVGSDRFYYRASAPSASSIRRRLVLGRPVSKRTQKDLSDLSAV